MKDISLTIGIPTYNRCETVLANLTHLQNSNLPETVKILIIDNASPDNSYKSLLKIANPDLTKVLKNDHNIGVAKNIIRLFRECDTEYLLITSDEDYIITENLPNFLEFIKKKSADFISPQAIIDGEVYRGISRSRLITAQEYRSSSNYASGITYKVSSCLEIIKKIEEYIDKEVEIAVVYSHVLLSSIIILSDNSYWYNQPLCKKIFQLPSDSHSKRGTYYFLNARWIQYSSQIDFFLNLLNDPEYHSVHHKIIKMLEMHLGSLNSTITSAIRYERSDIPGLEIYLTSKRFYSGTIKLIDQDSKYNLQIIPRFSFQKFCSLAVKILRKSWSVMIRKISQKMDQTRQKNE